MALQNRRATKGRHPLLKIGTLSQRVYNHLKVNPGLSITKIADTLKEDYQIVNGCLQRMKQAGLVIANPEQKGNRVIKVFSAVTENETGFARDTVNIESTVFVNDYGEYSVISRVVGELASARSDNPRPVHTHTHYIVVPKPTEPAKTRQLFGDTYTPGIAKNQDILITDAEYVVITEDNVNENN